MKDETFLENIGIKIKILRTKQKLSQEDLGLSANVERSYLGKIERGRQNPSLLIIKHIAEALNVEIQELLNFSF